MKNLRSILWFRNDLRLHDNEVLEVAAKNSAQVLPLYIIDDRDFRLNNLGLKKTGAHRINFLLEALNDLRTSLQKAGNDLLVLRGKPEEIIPELVHKYGISKVYASKEITAEEVALEEKVEREVWKKAVPLEFLWTSTLYHLDDIPMPVGNLPDVFTNFRKQVEKFSKVRPTIEAPKKIPGVEKLTLSPIPSIEELGFEKLRHTDKGVLPFKGGETAALERLQEYIWDTQAIRTYKETRNELLGANYSTKFSPWLALGCLSPRLIFESIKKYERAVVKNDSTYWVIFELIWRDYFKFVAKKYENSIFLPGGIKGEEMTPAKGNHQERFQRWVAGTTGNPFIDANMIELAETGFMSNRGRQNVASFLVKDLKVNWQYGAIYFESMLIDYDPCSNWCNWNYVAGVGNDPREDRYFNILSQAKRYDAKGQYVKHWIPSLAGIPDNYIHCPDAIHPRERHLYDLPDLYKKPMVSSKKWMK